MGMHAGRRNATSIEAAQALERINMLELQQAGSSMIGPGMAQRQMSCMQQVQACAHSEHYEKLLRVRMVSVSQQTV